MTTQPVDRPTPETPVQPDAGLARAIRMIVLGGVVALLAPLGGFLAGSMIGLDRMVGAFDAMSVALFAGMFVGGIGAVVAILGLLRAARRSARKPAGPPRR